MRRRVFGGQIIQATAMVCPLVASIACGAEQGTLFGRFEPDTVVRLNLTEMWRLGELDGAPEYTFGSISVIAESGAGSTYIADRLGPVLRKYDSTGSFLHEIGGPGEGPGEYRSLDGIKVLPNGDLVVYDAFNARLSWFRADGAFVTSVLVSKAIGGDRGFVVDRTGSAYVQVLADIEQEPSRGGGHPAQWARVAPDGSIERLTLVPAQAPVGPRYIVSGHGGPYHPFVTMTLSALGPDGSHYRVRNDSYRITHRSPDGAESVITRRESSIKLTRQELAIWRAFSEAAASTIRDGEQRSDYFPVPKTKPFIRELVVDDDGRLWVSRYTEAEFMEYSDWEREDRESKGRPLYEWRDAPRWDLFAPDDRYIGSVTLPFKTTFMAARGSHVWGITAGDFDEDYVIKWSLNLHDSDPLLDSYDDSGRK